MCTGWEEYTKANAPIQPTPWASFASNTGFPQLSPAYMMSPPFSQAFVLWHSELTWLKNNLIVWQIVFQSNQFLIY